jgi:hypothetical protein
VILYLALIGTVVGFSDPYCGITRPGVCQLYFNKSVIPEKKVSFDQPVLFSLQFFKMSD